MGTVVLRYFETPNGYVGDRLLTWSDEVAEMAKGQTLSCEILRDGTVALYARKKEWEEEDEQVELVVNGSGDKSPGAMLEKLIRRVNQMERPEGE